jgi:hypothetical protein
LQTPSFLPSAEAIKISPLFFGIQDGLYEAQGERIKTPSKERRYISGDILNA